MSFRGQRLTLDLIWIGLAIILSVPAGWFISKLLWPDVSGLLNLIAATALPILWTITLILLEYTRAIISSRQGVGSPERRLGPIGSSSSSYQLADDSGSEMRRELGVVGVGVLTGVLLLAPPVLGSGVSSFHPLMMPGAIVLGLSAVQLLPAIPLAGGHIFRAVFWYLHGSHLTGTRAAFLYSQLIASIGLGFGVFFLIWGARTLVPGVWCIFLGVLILQTSRREILRSTIIDRASTVHAADALSGLNPTIRAAAPLTEAVDILLEQKANGPALVRDRNVYVGMLDLHTVRSIPRNRWANVTAGESAISFDALIETPPGTDLLTSLRALESRRDSAVIIRDDNEQITGLIDDTLDPRLLLRRGIARTIGGTQRESTSSNGPRTS